MHSWPVLAKPNEAFKVQGNVFARVQQQPAPLTEVGRFQHGGGGAGLGGCTTKGGAPRSAHGAFLCVMLILILVVSLRFFPQNNISPWISGVTRLLR